MNSESLYPAILSLLDQGEQTATDLSRNLGVTKSEVNSCLYSGKGKDFLVREGRPPVWSSLNSLKSKTRNTPLLLDRQVEGPIHIDFSGGDWTLEIRFIEMSRNDPVALVEVVGPNSRIINISNQVVSQRERDFQEITIGLPDSAIVIAATTLVWEIVKGLDVETLRDFDFLESVKNVLLSIATQARISNS